MTPSASGGPAIRTPDHLLRVFVSSTLGELAAERRAARTAIERLHLAPVMFELGARPHPPRQLYRSYLEQSDVFVGIYADRYGWIAPGEQISGLEDEYRLADPRMPKLIYLRASDARDPRLNELIARIKADDTASYLTFSTEQELHDHLVNDLATLLAERFQAATEEDLPADLPMPPSYAPVPPPYTPIVGRQQEIAELTDLLTQRKARVVSIVGTGGIGKSRLAIEVALRAADRFTDGVVFVPLENVLDPQLLLPSLAQALGIGESEEAPIVERLPLALAQRQVLIVLDNFEQIAEAATTLVGLYSDAAEVAFLVTSRAVLRIRGEVVFELGGLPADTDAVELFVERARAVTKSFETSSANLSAVAAICAQLEGSPLAIELAAARVRVLTPPAILARLDRPLALLASAARDVPSRQRTLQATIEWSCNLLTAEQRNLLADLSVFAPGFGLVAIEAIGVGRDWGGNELEALSALIDNSLLRQDDHAGSAEFSMLATVREYGNTLLAASGDADQVRAAHAEYYTGLAVDEQRNLRGAGQVASAARLERELPNLRTAVRAGLELGRVDAVARLTWSLLIFWWFGGYFNEVRLWMQDLLAAGEPSDPPTRAVAHFLVNWTDMWHCPSASVAEAFDRARADFTTAGDLGGQALATACAAFTRMALPEPDADACRAELRAAVELFERIDDAWGAALALVGLGRVESLLNHNDSAAGYFLRAGELARDHHDTLATLITDHHIGRVQLFSGDLDAAAATFRASVRTSAELGMEGGIADGLEGLSAIAAARGQVEPAGLLAGAAEALRQRLGFFEVAAFVFHERYLASIRRTDPDAFDRARARGREFSTAQALAVALPSATESEVALAS